MNRFTLSQLTAATMVVSAGLMIGSLLTPSPSLAAKGGKGGGGGQPPTSATITVCEVGSEPMWISVVRSA